VAYDYLGEARKKREEAARARRLAMGLTRDRDFAALRAFADALEEEAKALERQAMLPREFPAALPPVTQVQQQAQQQSGGPKAPRTAQTSKSRRTAN
jgi:hypothetical protein